MAILPSRRRFARAAEAEERENYQGGRLPPDWREALEPLGTDWEKPFLEMAPWVVVLFEQRYGLTADETRQKHFYVKESVGMAAGLFVAALHHAGLSTLSHTPSPMAFLSRLLQRPANERPFALFPIGYPSADCVVPDLTRATPRRGDGRVRLKCHRIGAALGRVPVMDSPSDARSAALFRIFEYGAALDPVYPMSSAVADYRNLWNGSREWLIGPFSVSVNRLDEYVEWAGDDVGTWPVAITLDFPDPEWVAATRAGIATAQMFGARSGAKVRHYDAPLPTGAGLRHSVNMAMAAAGDMPVYFEVELIDERTMFLAMESLIAELDLSGPRLRAAAIIDPKAPPPIALLAAFLAKAQDARIRIRMKGAPRRPITSGQEPGILNVLAAFAFGTNRADIDPILRETNPGAFSLTDRALQMGRFEEHLEELGHLRWTELTAITLSDPAGAIDALTDAGFVASDLGG